jgi:hypothetical protein
MIKNNIMSKMNKKTVKFLTLITGIFGLAALMGLVTDYIFYNRLELIMNPQANLEDLKIMGGFVWLSFIALFFFHILAAGTLVVQLRFVRKILPISILAISAGVISFLGVLADWAVFGDITKEYTMGWDTSGEWNILRIILGIHTIFLLLVTGVCGGVLGQLRLIEQDKVLEGRDEIVFVVAQYVGIVCGIIGIIWIIISLSISSKVTVSVYHSMSTTVMILIPYGLIVSYWLIVKLKDHFQSWYDEKQWRDVTGAGFTTLLLMIPVMLFFFLAVSLRNEHFSNQIIWFPMFLFATLLFFSLFTLHNYRKG